MSDNTPPGTSQTAIAPITKVRVAERRDSAEYWVRHLPRYAYSKQRRADGWAIASGVIVALTGLAIWPVATETSAIWIRLVVGGGALAAAICALVPRVYNFGELAGQAREITGRYGNCYGDLVDLDEAAAFNPAAASTVVADFEAAKARKDGLRGVPIRPVTLGRDRSAAWGQAVADLTAQVKALQAAITAPATTTPPVQPPPG
jgi:hypothetical protein